MSAVPIVYSASSSASARVWNPTRMAMPANSSITTAIAAETIGAGAPSLPMNAIVPEKSTIFFQPNITNRITSRMRDSSSSTSRWDARNG